MPFGYLTTVAVVALCMIFAVAPPKPRRTSPTSVSYLLGFLVNELPFVAIYWLIASTALAAWQGDLATPVGLVGAGIAAVTALGLGVVARRGFAARPAVAKALADGLAGRRTAGAQRSRDVPSRHPWARILFAPLPIRARGVRRTSNVSYGDAGRSNLLDVYSHRSRVGGPILVYFHGGAFHSGRKSREARPLLHRLAARGWLCISANYRLAPAARFPEPLIDAKRVIAWARTHGSRCGADASTVVVAGSSAGAHLAAMSALTVNDPIFQPGFESMDTSVAAAVTLYGFFGSADSVPGLPSSPTSYLGPHAPPFFVAHGDQDTIVIVDDARRFVAALRQTSASPVVYAELPRGQHGFDLFRSARFESVVDGIGAFLAHLIKT